MATVTTETILWRGYASIYVWRRPIFIVLVLGLLGILILFSQYLPVPEEELIDSLPRHETHQYIAFSFWILAAIICAYIYIARISYGRYSVTSSRVIERHGVISNESNEVRIQDIRGINLRQSFVERLLGIGSLEISSAATEKQEVTFNNIRNPAKVKEIILGIQAYGYQTMASRNTE